LSGVEIEGKSPVRFVYADESGISVNESILVVAGVIIHADSQWLPVEQHIRALINKYVAEEDRSGFIFHAKDLFQGGGKIFGNREKYPLERSREALKEFLSIPSRFKVPIVYGFTRKIGKLPRKSDRPSRKSDKQHREDLAEDHARAFSLCAILAERFMRRYADPAEVATIIAEDNTQTRKTVKLMHDVFRGIHPSFAKYVEGTASQLNLGPDFFPLKKIVDTVHFVDKSGAFLLQIADASALIIRWYLEEKANVEEFVSAFTSRDPEIAIAKREGVRRSHVGGNDVRCWTGVAGT